MWFGIPIILRSTEKSYKNNITSFDKFKKPIKFVLFNDFDNPKKNQIYYMPLVNYNLYWVQHTCDRL